MVSKSRWNKAQEFEISWWKRKIETSKTFSVRKAKSIDFCGKKFNMEGKRVLDVGSGLRPSRAGSEFYALDPLANFFKKQFSGELAEEYVQGIGEQMPFESNFFDFIICKNSLYHSMEPLKFLSEARRCLCKNGVLLLSTTVFKKTFFPEVFAWLGFGHFAGHPHVFSEERLLGLLGNFFNVKKSFVKWDSEEILKNAGFRRVFFNSVFSRRGTFYSISEKSKLF